MAEIRPFRGLRYNPSKVDDLSAAICPPYDIIAPEEEQALMGRSPYNAVRVELGEANGSGAYEAAAATLHEWIAEGVLVQDNRPAFYLTRHDFQYLGGRMLTRTELTAAVRLEDLDKGIVIPHEATRSRAKEDRLQLLRATKANISPVMLLYSGQGIIPAPPVDRPILAELAGGERFRLWVITDTDLVRRAQQEVASKPVYIADGHHRYETALNYRNLVKAKDDDAAAYVMATFISFSDPGLLVLGYHRLLHNLDPQAKQKIFERIRRTCVEERRLVGDASLHEVARDAIVALSTGKALFALWGLEPGYLSLMSLAGDGPLDAIVAKGHSRAWAGLPNCVFREAILTPALGIQEEEAEAKGMLSFVKDTLEAIQAVSEGKAQVACLCSPIPFDAFREVSDRGERLPPKSTFFYPKLATGLVMKSVEGKL
ncbi:MAG: hypothetical protein HW397_542 [Dehalococcoidia bacterium]|nr:hypothetical protein [Dehalococcoidia bacterium]